jgi:hypothetical protein
MGLKILLLRELSNPLSQLFCFVVFFSRRLKIEKITKDSFVVSVCEDIRRIERVMRGAFPG